MALGMTTLAAVTGFLEPLSLLITIGGALGVAALTFPRERLLAARAHLQTALVPEAEEAEALLLAFRRLARSHRLDGPLGLEQAAQGIEDPFLARAVALILEAEPGEDIRAILIGEARARAADIEGSRQVVLTLGRLFPAFGLIGTLIGLALLLRNLNGGDLAAVAPGLGVAVLTTLYGSVMANVVILPLATRLQAQVAREALRLETVIAGALLLREREYPSRIERVLRAYLGRAGIGVARPTRVTNRAA
jgi:chemotaxis protein MotA